MDATARAVQGRKRGEGMTKEKILQEFSDINHVYNNCTRYDTLKHMLDELTEPKTGRWIEPQQDDGMSDPIYYQVRCSECGFDLDPQTWHMELHQYGADKYCPKCGAKMVDEQESEEV